jgi:hypothetical protein
VVGAIMEKPSTPLSHLVPPVPFEVGFGEVGSIGMPDQSMTSLICQGAKST